MESYLKLLQRWGAKVTKEDLVIPAGAPTTTKMTPWSLGVGSSVGKCIHDEYHWYDMSEQTPTGSESHQFHLTSECLTACADPSWSYYPQFMKAVGLIALAEALKGFETRDARIPEMALRPYTPFLFGKSLAFKTAEAAGFDLQARIDEHTEKLMKEWTGREREYIEEAYYIHFDDSQPLVYAKISFTNVGTAELFRRAFKLLDDNVYEIPLPQDTADDPAALNALTEFGRSEVKWGYVSSEDALDGNMLAFTIMETISLPLEARLDRDQFNETFKVMHATMDTSEAVSAAAAFVRS